MAHQHMVIYSQMGKQLYSAISMKYHADSRQTSDCAALNWKCWSLIREQKYHCSELQYVPARGREPIARRNLVMYPLILTNSIEPSPWKLIWQIIVIWSCISVICWLWYQPSTLWRLISQFRGNKYEHSPQNKTVQ